MTKPRITPPGFCPHCGGRVVQVFLALAPSNQYSYVCDAEPVPFIEGNGHDFVIDEYGKLRRGIIAVSKAKSSSDEPFYVLHTPTCEANIRKQGGKPEGDKQVQPMLGGEAN